MPAEIRRNNLLKKIKVPRFISSISLHYFLQSKETILWILISEGFFPFTFYSALQNYKQLLYVVVIFNSSENLSLRPVKLTLVFLTTHYNCGESTYLKLMQAERGHTAAPHPSKLCQLLLTGGSTGDKPVFTGALNKIC